MSQRQHQLGLFSLFLTLISLAIALTINAYPLYAFDISFLDLTGVSQLTKGELLENYRALLSYLNFPWITSLKLPDFPVSAEGAFHFWEVKKLFLLDYAILFITFFPSGYYLYRLARESSLWRLVRPFQRAALVPVVLGFLMLVGFDDFFVLFHRLFFDNDAWLFNPQTDPIINVLPQEFFLHSFLLVIVLFELFMFVGIFVGKRERKKT